MVMYCAGCGDSDIFYFGNCDSGDCDCLDPVIYTLEFPKHISANDTLQITMGLGYYNYNTEKNYPETVFEIEGKGLTINGIADIYTQNYDITQEKFFTKDNTPAYFETIMIKFDKDIAQGNFSIYHNTTFKHGLSLNSNLLFEYNIQNDEISIERIS